MKRKGLLFLLILPALILIPFIHAYIVTASDIDSAQYRATITVSNNGTSTSSGVATVFSANTTAWMDSDYINSSVNNTSLISSSGADLAYMPGYGGNPWVVWVPSIGGKSSLNDILYLGGESSMDSQLAYFPADTGMTTTDPASMEPSDNFSMELSGYVDTSTGAEKYLLEKESAILIYVSDTVSGNITASIATASSSSANITPNGEGDYTNVASVNGASTHWEAVDDPVGTPDDDATYVYTTSTSQEKDAYGLTFDDVTPAGLIGDVTIHFRIKTSYNGYSIYAQPYLRLGTSETTGTEVNTSSTTYTDKSETLARPGGGTWTREDLDDLQVVIGLRTSAGYQARLTQVYVEVEYTIPLSVSVTGIDSGDHAIKASANGTNFSLIIDEGEAGETSNSVALGGVSVPDNSNDWIVGQNGAMPYIEYYKHTVDGTLVQDIEWEYGATFQDQTAYNNDATPTFRTTTSDADVTASLTNFSPLTTAIAPAYAVSDAPLFITANITTSGNFTVGEVPTGGPPGSELVEAAAEAGGTPNIWIWGILAIVTIAMSGLTLSWMERRYGAGGGSLLLRIGIHVIILGLMITFGKFDWWMLIFYLIIASAMAMMSRHGEWGGVLTQHGLIGFLAQSWIGLTIINRILEGQLITSQETSWANYFAFTQTFNVFGIFNMPVLNFQFFTHGLPMLVKWDYSFFGGNAQMIQYLLYSLTAVLAFIIFISLISMMFNAFRAR